MIEEITLQNHSLPGRSIVMNRTSADYLIDDDGLDWGSIDSNLSVVNNFDSIGSKIRAIDTSTPRDIQIVGWVVGTPAQMAIKKHALSQLISPQDTITITTAGKTISTVATKSVTFGSTMTTNNECMCRFQIHLSAPYPFFEYSREYLNLQTGDTILNLGDIPVGAYAYFTFTESVTDPALILAFSNNRNAVIGLLGTFSSSDAVSVDTRYGARKVSQNGTKKFSILNTYQDWFEIPISYSDTDYGIASVSSGVNCRLYYSESYSALENL